jgi:hypothetical protein
MLRVWLGHVLREGDRMGWTSFTAVVRMLMPPWSGRRTAVKLDEDFSPLPHHENLCNSLLRNESDETIALDEAYLREFFFSQLQPSIDRQPLSAEAAKVMKLATIVGAKVPVAKAIEPVNKHEYKFYVDGLIELPSVERKSLSQRGGIFSLASPTTVSDDTVTTPRANPQIDRPEKSH